MTQESTHPQIESLREKIDELESELEGGNELPYSVDEDEWYSTSPSNVFTDVFNYIPEFMDGEDRKDAEFRANIVKDQFGDVVRHITHDPELNPNTRPLDEEQEVAWGDFFTQSIALAYLRGVDIEQALDIGLQRIQNREGYKQQSDEEMVGTPVYPENAGDLTGTSIVSGIVGEDVIVSKRSDPELFQGDLDGVTVVLTEMGGITSHAAILARELEVNCVVGVKKLTDNVSEGDEVEVNLDTGEVTKV